MSAAPKQKLPLEGVRVLELSHIVAGPSVGIILADMGAEVIKLEHLPLTTTFPARMLPSALPLVSKPNMMTK